ncbi:MAG: hypothetical protein AAGF84_10835 [Planctomycetota bacterium]
MQLTPPTDNLYKFIAIAGFIAMITGFVLQFQTVEDRLDRISVHAEAQDSAYLRLLEAAPIGEELNVNEAEKAAVIAKEMKTRQDVYGTTLTMVELRASSARMLQRLGLLVSMLGFYAWYFKVQRYEDELLRLRVKRA